MFFFEYSGDFEDWKTLLFEFLYHLRHGNLQSSHEYASWFQEILTFSQGTNKFVEEAICEDFHQCLEGIDSKPVYSFLSELCGTLCNLRENKIGYQKEWCSEVCAFGLSVLFKKRVSMDSDFKLVAFEFGTNGDEDTDDENEYDEDEEDDSEYEEIRKERRLFHRKHSIIESIYDAWNEHGPYSRLFSVCEQEKVSDTFGYFDIVYQGYMRVFLEFHSVLYVLDVTKYGVVVVRIHENMKIIGHVDTDLVVEKDSDENELWCLGTHTLCEHRNHFDFVPLERVPFTEQVVHGWKLYKQSFSYGWDILYEKFNEDEVSIESHMIVYTNGACRQNPGPGGWAWVVSGNDSTRRSGCVLNTTKYRMELQSVLNALETLTNDYRGSICIVLDSKYIVDCFEKKWYVHWIENGWKTWDGSNVKNQDLWESVLKLVKKKDVLFRYVRKNSGDRMNELANSLAVNAIP